jgi:hypothetical protein
MILESGATTPEELVTHKESRMYAFEYPTDSSKDEFHIDMDRFEAWCLGVMTKQIPQQQRGSGNEQRPNQRAQVEGE